MSAAACRRLGQWIGRHALERPGQLAVEDPGAGGATIDYAQLWRRIEELADHLRARGVGPEGRVGLLFHRSIDQIVALLAIHRAGGTYVPLDPAYPSQRLHLMLVDSGVQWLLTQRDLVQRLPEIPHPLQILDIDALSAEPADDPVSTPGDLPPRRGAYVIYTSGSSGRPKGVVVDHGALSWYVDTCIGHYQLTPADRLLHMASISFDISVGEIFPTLAAGATLVLDPPQPKSAAELFDLCHRHGVTVLFPPTALWHELARALGQGDPIPPSLRLVSFGGEKVAEQRLEDWRRHVGPRLRLVNGYGPTETTVEATLHELTPAMARAGEVARAADSIGRPVVGVDTQILDPQLRPAPAGEAGELCLASPGMARGYIGRPAITAERFVPNPNPRHPGERLYRTGDRVRRGVHGELEILGRIDDQVKIRGFRIEPGEIERQLEHHPAVSAAAVLATPMLDGSNEPGDRQLVAFVVPEESHTTIQRSESATGILGVGQGTGGIDAHALRDFLRQRLPASLVPQRILQIDQLPWTPNRKIDRRALAQRLHPLDPSNARVPQGLPQDPADSPTAERPGEDSPSAKRPSAERPSAERPEVETLTRLWAEILGLPSVSPRDDFFELGGDSILAIRIVALAQRHGIRLRPRDLFDHPTVAGLVESLVDGAGDNDGLAGAGVAADDAPAVDDPLGPVPLTPVQRWFFDEADLEEPWHFNQSMLVTLRQPLDALRLRRAVGTLVRHHDALRMRFRPNDGAPDDHAWLQTCIAPDDAVDPDSLVMEVDLRGLPAKGRTAALEHAASAIQGSLDLEQGPLLRLALFRTGGSLGRGGDRLLVAIHHLVVDGVTWGILFRHLERLLEGLDLPAPTTSYRRWANLQTTHADSEALRRELDHWTNRPAQAPPFPVDAPGPSTVNTATANTATANTTATLETLSISLDREHTEALLRRVPAVYRTRINDVLIAALARAYHRFTGGDPLLLDVEGHGREELFTDLEFSRTVGWFTSTFPIWIDLPNTGDSEALPGYDLKWVKEALRAVPRHGVGFGMLFYLCSDPQVRRALHRLPRPQISFNYLGQLDALLEGSRLFDLAPESRGREKGLGGRRSYVLEIDGGIVDGRLWMNWHYSRALHRRSTLESLAHGFRRALEELITHCLRPGVGGPTPSDVPLAQLDQGTLDHLFSGQRRLEDLYPLAPMQQGMLFHSLLEPDSAVYFEQSSWSLEGPLDPAAFGAAWQRLMDRHTILRSSFVWRDLERPLQAVWRHVDMPITHHDWRGDSAHGTSDLDAEDPDIEEPDAEELRLAQFLENDRRHGFPLDQPPLTRVALIRLGDTRHRFVWSYHHALLDGWSISALFDEFFTTYGALVDRRPPHLPAALPHRRHIEWLESRRPDEGLDFFQRLLEGVTSVTPVPLDTIPAHERQAVEHQTVERLHHLPRATGEALEQLARRERLTVGTWVIGAWALLLGHLTGRDDVLFGLTVSGRPADLEDADRIVGLLINTLPLRLRLPKQMPLRQWLAEVQGLTLDLRQHEHCSLVDIHAASSVPADRPLFENLLVFENYPVDGAALEDEQRRGALTVGQFQGYSETNYPFTLAAVPADRLRLAASYDPNRFDGDAVQRLLGALGTLLTAFVGHPNASLGELDSQIAVPALSPGTTLGGITAPPTRRRRPQGTSAAIQALRDRARQRSTDRTAASLERSVGEIWRKTLGVAPPRPDDNFFEQGGHSLLAMRLIARLRRSLGLELPLRRLFERPTFGDLLNAVAQGLGVRIGADSPALAVPATPGMTPRPAHLPLALEQQRLWLLEQLSPGDPAQLMADAWRVCGPLDTDALDAALHAMVRRHESLRTAILETTTSSTAIPNTATDDPDGPQPVRQVVTAVEDLPAGSTALRRIDLRHLPITRRPHESRRLLDRLAVLPFDLSRPPLLRLVLVTLDDHVHHLSKTQHHMVGDAWSDGIFYRELSLLHRAARLGHPSPLEPLPIQYADHCLWQAQALRDDTLERLTAWWRRTLDNPPELRLPSEPHLEHLDPNSTHRGSTHRPGHLTHRLEPSVVDQLRRIESVSATPFVITAATFSALLLRLGAGEDLILGAPMAHRPTVESEALIGFFVGSLPLRLDLSGNPDLHTLIDRTRDVVLHAWEHRGLPFDRVVEAVRPRRRPGRHPLIDAMVEWVDGSPQPLEFDGLDVHAMPMPGSSGPYDLSLTVLPGSGDAGPRDSRPEDAGPEDAGPGDTGRVLDLEFDASRIEPATARRWARHYATLLDRWTARPEMPLDAVPLLTDAEIHQLIREGQSPDAASDAAQLHPAPWDSVLHRIHRCARTTPGAIAVVDGATGHTTSYGELWTATVVGALHLRSLGLGRETPVIAPDERSIPSLVAVLAILAAGGTWVPMAQDSPPRHRRALRRLLEPCVTLDPNDLPGANDQTDDRDASADAGAPLLDAILLDALDPRQAAYILHTSGSTGQPKGVVVDHRALAGYTENAADAYGLSPDDRVLQFAPWTFDIAVEEIFPTLARGATLVLRSPETAGSIEAFSTFCTAQGITFTSLPTAFWHRLAEGLDTWTPPKTLRVVIGGEKARPEWVRAWRATGIPLIDTYGPTETTVVATRVPVAGAGSVDGALGHPIDGTQVHVLDGRLVPVPWGVAGELVIGGHGLARGYRGRPAATAERFVPNPFAPDRPGDRLYRTGDRGRRLADGSLQFLGRLDRQLKVRGFRIEPGEVEAALRREPSVADAVVADAVVPGAVVGGERRLVAWVVPADDPTTFDLDALRRAIADRLPAHLRPTAWVTLDALPLDARGKLDRRRLPAPQPMANADAMPPEGALENALADLWWDVLGTARPGRHDNFFDLGGDSLLALHLLTGLRRLGFTVDSQILFRHQTVAELAAHLESVSQDGEAIPEAEQGPVTGPVALTPIQRWFFEWPVERRWHFNQSMLLVPEVPLDPNALRHAVRQLLLHHDALRLRFEPRPHGWQQNQGSTEDGNTASTDHRASPTLLTVDLTSLDPERAIGHLDTLFTTVQASLHLTRGPLVRVAHVRLATEERLLIVVHHLAVDGVSWPILIKDLETAYAGFVHGRSVDLPPKTTSFRAWSEALTRHAHQPALLTELTHWHTTLGRRSALPTDLGDPQDATAQGLVESHLDPTHTEQLLRRANAAERRIDHLLLTALVRTLAAWSGERSALVELESHGRATHFEGIDVSRTVGWFTATYPVWLELRGDDPQAQIRAIGEQLASVPSGGVHYGLLRYLAPSRNGVAELRRLPHPQVNFNYLGQLDPAVDRSRLFRAAQESPGPEQGHPGAQTHLFDLNGRVVDGCLRMDWAYSPECYYPSTVERLARRYLDELLILLDAT